MGQIQLKVGALTSTKTAADADMTKILGLVFDAHAPKFDRSADPPVAITYTAQQQLDFVVGVIVGALLTDAKYQAAKVKRIASEVAINEEAGGLNL